MPIDTALSGASPPEDVDMVSNWGGDEIPLFVAALCKSEGLGEPSADPSPVENSVWLDPGPSKVGEKPLPPKGGGPMLKGPPIGWLPRGII